MTPHVTRTMKTLKKQSPFSPTSPTGSVKRDRFVGQCLMSPSGTELENNHKQKETLILMRIQTEMNRQ